MYEEITEQARQAVTELLEVAKLRAGDLFVIGCSSSEMVGLRIGKGSSLEAAQAAFRGVYPALQEHGIYLAVQCCEHLNRALILEEEAAEKFGYDIVNVKPWPHAGGSFATTAWENFHSPVAVEHIRAKAGIDIGGTLIGMHLRDVAVPVRLSIKAIGQAQILCARTRPKSIGGERARYVDELK
ncbi:MAG: TIGR01440 family protein [Oscillospiraceae bacterium]|nr:TIGR01440 family protein [Oscillospiraceae bacterium]